MMRVALCLLAGCTWAMPTTPTAVVEHGPAFAAPPHVLAALPIGCAICNPDQRVALATRTRMALEYAGYSIIDSELVNAEARRRHVTTVNDATTVELTGGAPADAAALAALGADGILREAVVVAPAGFGGEQRVDVRIAIHSLDGRLAWHADCAVMMGAYEAPAQVIDRIARCALESGARR